MNNLKAKIDDLDVAKLKNVPVDLKKLSDVVDNEVAKNTEFSTLKTKVNDLDKKITDSTILIHINQYNADKQNFEKKLELLIKNTIVTTTVLNTKINGVEKKIPDTSSLVTTTVLNKNLEKLRTKLLITMHTLLVKNLIS